MQRSKNFLNWATISRHLAGSRVSIQKDNVPKIHQHKIKELTDFIDNWKNKWN